MKYVISIAILSGIIISAGIQFSFYMGKMSCELEQYRKSDKVQVVT